MKLHCMATIANFQNDQEKKEKEEQTLFILLELSMKKIHSFTICCNSLLQVIGSNVQDGTGHIHVMGKHREKHCVIVLEKWSRGEDKTMCPKQYGRE